MSFLQQPQLPGQLSASSTITSSAAAITSLAAELQTSIPNSIGMSLQQQQQQQQQQQVQQQQMLTSQAQPSPCIAQSQAVMPNRTPTPNMTNARPPSAGGKQLPISQKSQPQPVSGLSVLGICRFDHFKQCDCHILCPCICWSCLAKMFK